MFNNLLLENYNAIICEITMQASRYSVDSKLLKNVIPGLTLGLQEKFKD